MKIKNLSLILAAVLCFIFSSCQSTNNFASHPDKTGRHSGVSSFTVDSRGRRDFASSTGDENKHGWPIIRKAIRVDGEEKRANRSIASNDENEDMVVSTTKPAAKKSVAAKSSKRMEETESVSATVEPTPIPHREKEMAKETSRPTHTIASFSPAETTPEVTPKSIPTPSETAIATPTPEVTATPQITPSLAPTVSPTPRAEAKVEIGEEPKVESETTPEALPSPEEKASEAITNESMDQAHKKGWSLITLNPITAFIFRFWWLPLLAIVAILAVLFFRNRQRRGHDGPSLGITPKETVSYKIGRISQNVGKFLKNLTRWENVRDALDVPYHYEVKIRRPISERWRNWKEQKKKSKNGRTSSEANKTSEDEDEIAAVETKITPQRVGPQFQKTVMPTGEKANQTDWTISIPPFVLTDLEVQDVERETAVSAVTSIAELQTAISKVRGEVENDTLDHLIRTLAIIQQKLDDFSAKKHRISAIDIGRIASDIGVNLVRLPDQANIRKFVEKQIEEKYPPVYNHARFRGSNGNGNGHH